MNALEPELSYVVNYCTPTNFDDVVVEVIMHEE